MTIRDILERMYTTAVQDAYGVVEKRKNYRMRFKEVPEAVEAEINAYILGEVIELIGTDTQTMHDDNGISDFANIDIDIAITDLINWVNNGGKIDVLEKDRLKNRIIERVHGSRQEHGANQLRQELRNKANKKWGSNTPGKILHPTLFMPQTHRAIPQSKEPV